MAHYGIIGGGKHATPIIEDGLKDIFGGDSDHTLYVYCRKGATDSEKVVYTHVLDNQVPFIAVSSEGSAPKVLVETADYLMSASSAEEVIIKELAANNGTLLVMWDDERDADMSKFVTMASDFGVTVLELSNGLTPIILEEQPVHITETVVAKEVELEPLTTDELDSMNIGLLKKAAFAQGIADAGGMSKQELVVALSEDDSPVVSADLVATETVRPLNVTEGQLNWIEDGVFHTVMLGPEFTKRFLADLRYKPI